MAIFSMHPAVDTSADGGVLSPMSLDFNLPFEGQVLSFFRGMGDLRRFDAFVLPGQAVAGILTLPLLEMAAGMPVIVNFGYRDRVEIIKCLALGDYRRNVVRPRRVELPSPKDVATFDGYTVLDGGGRGMTPMQLEELAEKLGCGAGDIRVLDLNTGHVDMTNPTEGMVDKVIATGVSRADLTSGCVLYLPAGNGLVAALQATTIYGLSEVWPRTIRLIRRDDWSFGVGEIIDIQALRKIGEQIGAQWRAGDAPILVPRGVLERVVVALEEMGHDTTGLLGEMRELLAR